MLTKYPNLWWSQELSAAFDQEAATSGKPRLLLSAAVAAGIDKIDAGYEVSDIIQ